VPFGSTLKFSQANASQDSCVSRSVESIQIGRKYFFASHYSLVVQDALKTCIMQ
jgi:hypothetical protein